MNVLILGIGNMLLSDEGLGLKVVEDLQRRYLLPAEVTVIDGGTMGLDLLPYLDDRTHLFIVDAIRSDQEPPGSIRRLDLDDPPAYFRTKISPHQLGISDVLAVAAMNGTLPGKIVLFGAVPKSLSTGLDLSPEVSQSVRRLSGLITDDLQALGLKAQCR